MNMTQDTAYREYAGPFNFDIKQKAAIDKTYKPI